MESVGETNGKFIIPTVEKLVKPTEKNLSCLYKECQRVFKHRSALNMHLTQTHKLQGYGDYSKKEKQLYLCPVNGCPRSSKDNPFTCMQTIRRHYVNIHSEKNLQCDSCSRKFANENHIRSHKKSCGKLYMCSLCNVPYASLEGVTKHQQNMHTAIYKQAKALNKQHSCYTIVDSDSVQKPGCTPVDQTNISTTDTSVKNSPISCATAVQPSTTRTLSAVIVYDKNKKQLDVVDNESNRLKDCDNQSMQSGMDNNHLIIDSSKQNTGTKKVYKTGTNKLTNLSKNKCSSRYVPLLPKPVNHGCNICTEGNKELPSVRKEIGTQTDLLGTAVRSSNIILEDQCTNTADGFQPNQFPTKNARTVFPQYAQPSNSFASMMPLDSTGQTANSQLPWPQSFTSSLRSPALTVNQRNASSATPADFGTQTTMFEDTSRTTPISHLGTQTTLSDLLEEVGRSSSSIELQCELGEASLHVSSSQQSLTTMEEVMSFGTQTNPTLESHSYNATDADQAVSAEVSSFGTQTMVRSEDDMDSLRIPESFPLQNSTSDFSMQFPYELMDFGTQTSLLDEEGNLTGGFLFDDELLNDQSNGTTAQLSQSSTQTDLDFLFNHIETQTDWHI